VMFALCIKSTCIEIKVSSARELRAQLREIAPMNDDGRSKIFCPNGTFLCLIITAHIALNRAENTEN
jgi:hypothetical protein